MQFGPSLDKRKMIGLVEGTLWNEFIELNRMAFSDFLPRNSESRAIGYAFRWMRKQYPQIKWCVSFADGTQCGDGTTYRASGFALTGIKENSEIWRTPDGRSHCKITYAKGRHILKTGKADCAILRDMGAKPLPGFQLRYMYFLDPSARQRLTVPILPFSDIDRLGAGMYKGKTRVRSADSGTPDNQSGGGGANPTRTLPNPSLKSMEV